MGKPRNTLTDPVISIGTLAAKTGLSVSAIRKYEAEGLLIPYRTPTGNRLFSHEDMDRIKIIRHMIQELGLNMEGIRRLQALLPCWEVAECSKKRRGACAAYKGSSKPCWMIKGGNCSPKGNECRSCVVYRFGSQCTEDIKGIVYGRSGLDDISKEVRAFLDKLDSKKEEEG
ncbi:MAG: MerR family transcriptional regulator [Elusimicrobiota bacterium]